MAAANDVDTRAWYLSGGRSVRVAEERARATVVAYLAGSAGDWGIAGAWLGSVVVVAGDGGPEVTVRVTAPARAGLLRLLHLIPPEMEGRAAATARLVPPYRTLERRVEDRAGAVTSRLGDAAGDRSLR